MPSISGFDEEAGFFPSTTRVSRLSASALRSRRASSMRTLVPASLSLNSIEIRAVPSGPALASSTIREGGSTSTTSVWSLSLSRPTLTE
jgi:hypothetical protein